LNSGEDRIAGDEQGLRRIAQGCSGRFSLSELLVVKERERQVPRDSVSLQFRYAETSIFGNCSL